MPDAVETLETARTAADPAHFRYVLGQYPTGVTLITATQTDGEPIGMVVGTFTSVSLDPPLVAFLPDRKSSSWPKIREAGSFCANVLTAAQQDVCRAFARKQDDRFDLAQWETTGTGSPRLVDAAAWIDCTIEDVVEAGDHDIVLGRVGGLDVGDSAELPLLFLRGGYGSFSIPSIQSLDTDLPRHMRAVDIARSEIESIAEDLGLECLVSVAVEDTVVVVSAAGVERSPHGAPSRVGLSFPLAAPLAPVHVAWAGVNAEQRWLANGRQVAGSVAASVARAELDRVRAQGYAVSTGSATAAEFERVMIASDTGVPDLTGVLPDLVVRAGQAETSTSDTGQLAESTEVTSLHAPAFGPDGQVAISLTLNGFQGQESPDRLQECLDRLLSGTAQITNLLGGHTPA
jgi:flavin reductase (DIM6/NTAB) family NADH-FMN oxidoreductase RutF/DNA-binding IclR family transcriptional regulator